MRRDETFAALERERVDVLVIGGGIVGTGIARDLSLRGLKVALVEQHDLASGTSSRPTRLIHGGLRYLEMFDFALVRTDMREREVLLRKAPHLVQPLRAEPSLNATDLQGAWQFYDGQVSLVERLVIENALDAASEGGLILTYARAERFVRDASGAVLGAVIRDALSGREIEARARLTVNASGPWLDLTTAGLRPGRRPLLRLTKGVHLVTPSATHHAHVLFARRDGRLFFVIPWLGYSLVGTTDTDYHGDPADVAATAEDVSYLVDEAQRAFPAGRFDEVHYTWAGVRALVRMDDVDEGRVSRKHALHDHGRWDGVAGVV